MKNLVFIVLVILASVYVYKNKFQSKPQGLDCEGEIQTLTQQDPSMSGLINPGESFTVRPNWYKCHAAQRNDLVLLRISDTPHPKILRGISGDKFKLVQNRTLKAWHLIINGRTVMQGQEPYHFGGVQPPLLQLYETSRKGILGPGEILVLSAKSPGDKDSGIFGIFSINDLQGQVTTPRGLTSLNDGGLSETDLAKFLPRSPARVPKRHHQKNHSARHQSH